MLCMELGTDTHGHAASADETANATDTRGGTRRRLYGTGKQKRTRPRIATSNDRKESAEEGSFSSRSLAPNVAELISSFGVF